MKLIIACTLFYYFIAKGREYKVGPAKTWQQAKQYCSDTFGTTLATITSQEDRTNAQTALQSAGSGWGWIGMNDLASQGTWVWDDGTDCSYAGGNCKNDPFWNPGEPTGGGERCTYFSTSAAVYNDNPCSNTPSTLCNYEPQPQRDCSVLAIDEFLTQCSTEFNTQNTAITDLDAKITQLQTDLQIDITQNANGITQLQTDLANAGAGTKTQITQLQTDLDDVTSRLDLFAAKSVFAMVDNSESNSNSFNVGIKNLFVILLLVVNLITMAYIYCYKNGSKNNKKQYSVPYDDDSDATDIEEK